MASLAAAIAFASCATVPAAIPVSGPRGDLAQLAGQWSGEYHSTSTGRQGSILFQLAADADTAHGDVLMFPTLSVHGGRPGDERTTSRDRLPQNLTISFVRAAEGQVMGKLDPYRDPECDCLLNTTFEGRIVRDRITGTYTSIRLSDGSAQQGEWSVKRRSD
jgi:hypothetical protein